jgi:hypothetical protein
VLARAPFAATATLLRTHELTVYELTTFLDQNYAVLKHDAVLSAQAGRQTRATLRVFCTALHSAACLTCGPGPLKQRTLQDE